VPLWYREKGSVVKKHERAAGWGVFEHTPEKEH
jgi:hypothetical protein